MGVNVLSITLSKSNIKEPTTPPPKERKERTEPHMHIPNNRGEKKKEGKRKELTFPRVSNIEKIFQSSIIFIICITIYLLIIH